MRKPRLISYKFQCSCGEVVVNDPPRIYEMEGIHLELVALCGTCGAVYDCLFKADLRGRMAPARAGGVGR